MNSIEIFSIALGLCSPWHVEKAEFLDSAESISKELHLYLNFEPGYKFPSVSEETSTAYDTVDRVWCGMAMDSKIVPYQKFVNLIKAHWSGITAYFNKRVSNGVLEALTVKYNWLKEGQEAIGIAKTSST
jgi:hypothetical protein